MQKLELSHGRRFLASLLFLVFLAAAVAPGQTFTGTISGVIRDATGAVVPNASLSLVNVNTNEQRRQATGSEGRYTFPSLPPGAYRLEAEAAGFRKFVHSQVTVEVQQQVSIDIDLQVGSASESVEVREETPLLQPTTSSLGQVVDNRKIMELPLVGRNTLALIGLTAGAQPIGAFGGIPARGNSYAGGFFSTSGSQVLTNETLVDGVPANAAVFNTPAFVPTVDTVQEFKVQTSNFSAEFGRTGGGVVNIVTKSGTNDLHGSFYEFLRNDKLDANNWFNNRAGRALPHNTFNQFGGTAGGPVMIPKLYDGHNKTFWFFNYEALRERRGLSDLMTIPAPAQLQGDFSQTFNSAGQLMVVADPLSTRADPTSPGRSIRDAFAGNRVPANRLDPVAVKTRGFWPAPNTQGDPRTGASNFLGIASAPNIQDQFTIRVDQSVGSKHRLFARVAYSDVARGGADYFANGMGFVNPGGGGVTHHFSARNVALNDSYVATPTLLFDFRYGFSRQFPWKTPALTGMDLTTIGMPAELARDIYFRAMPAIQPSGYRSLAAATSDLIRRGDNSHALQGGMTKVLNRHTLKTGVDLRYIPINELQPNAPQGVFNFDGRFTSIDPLRITATSGNSVASYLLGHPSSGSADYNPALSVSSKYYGTYIQDDFKFSSRLTLNFGLRYEAETGRNERYDRLSWFNSTAANPLASKVGLSGLKGGLEFAAAGGNPRRQKNIDKNNFGPRFGFALQADRKTILRGGYAVFYLPGTGDDTGQSLGASGFFAITTFVSSLDGGITPADKLSNPFPRGLSRPPGSSPGLASQIGQDINTLIRGDRSAYSQEWNFNVQRELPAGFLFDVAYAGSKGTKLPINIQFNQLPDEFLSLGSRLLAQVPNPFADYATVGVLSGPTIPAGQLLRPYPQFGSVNMRAVRAGSSIYHSMQMKFERRFSRGFSLLGAYTVSKLITDTGSRLSIGFSNPGFQNNNNRRAERSLGNVDIPQRFVLSYNWELPIGPGKALLGGSRGVVGKIVGGWGMNGVTVLQSGPPLSLGTSANQTNSFGGSSRPNNSGQSAKLSGSVQDRLNRYFDTSVFSQPAAFTFGNVGRTLPDVRAPGRVNFDFSTIKNIPVTERVRMQFRAEFFNLFNRPMFGGPGTTLGTSSFGVISSADDGRTIQFGLKLIY